MLSTDVAEFTSSGYPISHLNDVTNGPAALGNHYESKSQHYLAAPLYLQAITLSPPKSCHSAVLSKYIPCAHSR